MPSEPVCGENGRLLGFVESLPGKAFPMFRCRDALGELLRWTPIAEELVSPPRLFQTAIDAAAYVRARAPARSP